MNRHFTLMVGMLLLTSAGALADTPISLHPENPHYFQWRGHPTILITSAEHYGAVINLDFDYHKYLETMAAEGMNYTRIFSGAYVEPQGAFNIARNTLAPAANRFICPWPRSQEPGYAGGGNKFDLSAWDPAYFERLRGFVGKASEQGIVVELALFCPMYEEKQWALSPMKASNNINGWGECERTSVYTLDKNGALLGAQTALTRKLVSELNAFDNVFFEISNEPYFGGVTMDWQHHIADTIVATEKELPNQHLIAQNIANNKAAIIDPHPAISIFNFHYATPPDTVAMNYHLNKVIGDDETGFRGTGDAAYRTEAWDFIIAGGGLYNNLDYSFCVGHEDGTFAYPDTQPGGGNTGFRQQIRILSEFMHGFDFIRMKPDTTVIKGGVPLGGTARALVAPNQAMAIYVRHEGSTGPWSARWTGFLEAPLTGEYALHTYSNDGIRLWLGNEKLIEDWTDHGEKEDTATMSLTKGQRYPLTLEYFYNGGQGASKLWWTTPGGKKEPVPANAFRLPDEDGWGLRGVYFSGIDLKQPMAQRDDGQINFDWGVNPPIARQEGDQQATTLEIELTAGWWQADWIDTKTGAIAKQERVKGNGTRSLEAPPYQTDIALRLRQVP